MEEIYCNDCRAWHLQGVTDNSHGCNVVYDYDGTCSNCGRNNIATHEEGDK